MTNPNFESDLKELLEGQIEEIQAWQRHRSNNIEEVLECQKHIETLQNLLEAINF